MTLLPYYLYKKIILNIVFYKYENNKYLYFSNNETIDLCLVCKYWFNIISKNLTNPILNQKNYGLLKPLIETINFREENKYRLIKLNNSCINYLGLKEFEKNLEFSNLYRIIYLNNLNNNEVLEIINNIENKYPQNLQFNVLIENGEFINNFENDQFQKCDKISNIYLNTRNIQDLLRLIKYGQKNISISLLNPIQNNKMVSALFFETNSNEKIDLDDYIYLKSTENEHNFDSKEVSTKKLQSFDLSVSFKDMIINVINNQYYNYDLKNGNDREKIKSIYKNAWEKIINHLGNDKTLKTVRFYHYCQEECEDCMFPGILDDKDIYKGLKSILSNPNCSIQNLTIDLSKPLHQDIIEGLSLNNSIKSLQIFKSNFLIQILNKLLTKNKSIRHLTLTCDYQEIIDKIHPSLYKGINLYSITFYFNQNSNCKKLINLICQFEYPIKEFNIINNIGFAQKIKYQFNNNNSIINVYDIIN